MNFIKLLPKALSAWVIGIMLFGASGCTLIPHLVIWNNSGQSLMLQAEGKFITIGTKSSAEVRFPGNTMGLSIETASKQIWRYKARYPDQRYVLENRIYVQVEADGLIHVLPSKPVGVVTQLPRQPEGYPLKPTT